MGHRGLVMHSQKKLGLKPCLLSGLGRLLRHAAEISVSLIVARDSPGQQLAGYQAFTQVEELARNIVIIRIGVK